MSSANYRTLLRTPGVAAFYLSATAGRMGIAMTSLGIVWLVYSHTGSYAIAGLVTGGFAVAEALVGPQLARLFDRYGQTRVLPSVLFAHTVAVSILLAVVSNGIPLWMMTAGGVLVGATIPQLGALSAARWPPLLTGAKAAALPTAFALESLSNAVSYLAGPTLVIAAVANGHPTFGTVLAVTFVVGGGLSFAAQRRTSPIPVGCEATSAQTRQSPWQLSFVVLAGINLAIGGFFGAMQVSVTAFLVELDGVGSAPFLYFASECASLFAGWYYGFRHWGTAPRAQLAMAAFMLALCTVPILIAGSLLWLAICLAFTGLAVPVVVVLCTVLAQSTVDRTVLTRAFAWLSSASAAGSAGTAALSGRAVDSVGSHGGFVVAFAATAAVAVLALVGLRVLRVSGCAASVRRRRHPCRCFT